MRSSEASSSSISVSRYPRLLPGSPAAGDVGEWLDGYIFALAGPIYAGTNEIQKNIIAERILGLPAT